MSTSRPALVTSTICRLLWLATGLLAATPLVAQTIQRESSPHPKTCLVLGGGGARGAAHIGLLKVIEREKIQVDCVVGTSMGAIVGGLYAAGYGPEEIEKILVDVDWSDIFHDKPGRDGRSIRRKEDDLRWLGGVELGVRDGKISFPRGLIQGQKLQLLLRRLFLPTWQDKSFDDLPIPFRAVATDLVTGEKVVFSEGDLAMSIRASMSVPGVFEPVRLDGRLLVDGGVVDNVPIDEARKMGAERMIVSRVGSPMMTEEELTSPLAVAHQMMGALMQKEVEAQLATLGPEDLLITPPLGKMGSQDFAKGEFAVGVGFQAAEEAAPELRRFSVGDAHYAEFQARHHVQAYAPPTIEFVDVEDARSRTGKFVNDRAAPDLGKPLDVDALETQIGVVYGDGRYQNVGWNLEQRDNQTGLLIEPVDREWGPNYLRFVLRLSDNFDGQSNYQLLSEYSLTGLNQRGGEARFGLGIGERMMLHAEFYQPFGSKSRQSLQPYLDYAAQDFPVNTVGPNPYAEYRASKFAGGMEWAYSPDDRWRVSAAVEGGVQHQNLLIGDSSGLKNERYHLRSARLGVEYDSLDAVAFPSSGQRMALTTTQFTQNLGGDRSAEVTTAFLDAAWSWGENRWLVGGRLHTSRDGEGLFDAYGSLGGFVNLSGYAEGELRAQQTALLRAIYYRKLGHADAGFKLPLYFGASAELGGTWARRGDIAMSDMITAGSVFLGVDSFLGPIYLGYGRAEEGRDAFYLTFGSFLRTTDTF